MRARILVMATAVLAVAAVAVSLFFAAPTVKGADHSAGPDFSKVRAATAQFDSLEQANKSGYGLLKDAAGIACIANTADPQQGAMGIHYVNGTLVGSGVINEEQPQALVYEPDAHGNLHLVALEYIAFQQQWDATHTMAPMAFGQMFMLTTSPNRFGLPAFYSLHVWLYKDNPSGTFNMWNPAVHCPAA